MLQISSTPENEVMNSSTEARLSMFVAEHTSLRSIDHLSDILKVEFADSKNATFRLKRSKCAKIIIEVLAPHFLEELVKDLGTSSYSLLLDESTDIAVVKKLGVVIRYVSEEKKRNSFDIFRTGRFKRGYG